MLHACSSASISWNPYHSDPIKTRPERLLSTIKYLD
jgi:hypothetical protein